MKPSKYFPPIDIGRNRKVEVTVTKEKTGRVPNEVWNSGTQRFEDRTTGRPTQQEEPEPALTTSNAEHARTLNREVAAERRTTKPLLHRRGSGRFGFSGIALCGEKGDKVKMTSHPKFVTCPKCRERIEAQRTAARERTSR